MVSPVRVRVPPLLFCSNLQVNLSTLLPHPRTERTFYHNVHALEVLREEIVEAHGRLAVHGGGDLGVGVGGLLHGSVPEHLRDQLQLLPVLGHERGENEMTRSILPSQTGRVTSW